MQASNALRYLLPFSALDATAQPVAPDLQEAVDASTGIWQGTLEIDAPVNAIKVQAATAGQLTYAKVNQLDQFTLDATAFVWIFSDLLLRDMGISDPYVPLIGKLVFTGPLDTSTFMPTSAAKRRQKGTGQSLAHAAQGLLSDLQAGDISSIAVSAGDILGSVGAASVKVGCLLPDGSSVPLGFLFNYLVGVAPRIVGSQATNDPWMAGQVRSAFIDAVVPADGDLFELLPTGSATASVVCALDNSAQAPATLIAGGGSRRFVFSAGTPQASAGVLTLSVGGAPVPIHVADATAGSPTAAATVPADGQTHLLSIGPTGPGIVISSPAMTAAPAASQWDSLLALSAGAPGTNEAVPVTIAGASGGSQVTLTATPATGSAAIFGPYPVSDSKWTTDPIALPFTGGPLTLRVGDDQGASLSVLAVPLSIQLDKLRAPNSIDTMPVVELTAHPPGRDSLELQAWVKGADDLANALNGTGVTAWVLEVRTAAVTRAKSQNGGDPQLGDPTLEDIWRQITYRSAGQSLHGTFAHWVPFRMSAANTGAPTPVGDKWNPPPLIVDRASVQTSTANFDVLDCELLLGPWTGNDSQSAGPVVGTAALSAEVSVDGTTVAKVPALIFQVQGYNSLTTPFGVFYAELLADVSTYFGSSYPCKTALHLANGLEDLCRVLLAIYPVESHYMHFDDISHNWVWAAKVQPHADRLPYWPQPQPVLLPQAPAEVAIPGMPSLGPPADAGLGAISSNLTFAPTYTWQLNMDTSVSMFRQFFDNVRSYARAVERGNLLKTNPAATGNALSGPNAALLDPYLNALFADKDKLLSTIISRYNGPGAIPYKSNLTWDGTAFVAGTGDAIQPSDTDGYSGPYILPLYHKLLTRFSPPDNGGTIIDLNSWSAFLGQL